MLDTFSPKQSKLNSLSPPTPRKSEQRKSKDDSDDDDDYEDSARSKKRINKNTSRTRQVSLDVRHHTTPHQPYLQIVTPPIINTLLLLLLMLLLLIYQASIKTVSTGVTSHDSSSSEDYNSIEGKPHEGYGFYDEGFE